MKYVKAYRGSFDFSGGGIVSDILLGGEGGSVLKKPMGVFVGNDSKIYVTDTANSDVFIFDPKNSKMNTIGGMGAKIFYKPIGVTADTDGRIFVADSQVDKVTVLSSTAKILAYLQPDEPFKQPSGIIADSINRRLYVTDTHTHNIKVFDLDTLKNTGTIGKRGKEEGEFNFPSHLGVDTDGLRNLLTVILQTEDIQVEAAENGREGIALFASKHFDLVFTVLGMPEMSGWQVAKEIKKLDDKTPVALITGWHVQLNDAEKKEKGVDLIINKPFKVNEILKLVEEGPEDQRLLLTEPEHTRLPPC